MAKKKKGIFEKEKGSGVWWINLRENGERHRQRIGSFEAAVAAYKLHTDELHEGRYVPPRSADHLKFGELMDQAFADRKLHLAGSSYDSDETKMPKLREWFGEVPAVKLTTAMIRAHLDELLKGGLKGATVNRYKALLSAVFTWGMKNARLKVNPVKGIENLPEDPGRTRFLDAEEEGALRAVIQRDYPEGEAELDFLLFTGLRQNALFQLRWSDVDIDHRIITVREKRPAKGQGSGQRIVRLNANAVAALLRLREQAAGSSAYVVPGPEDREGKRDWRDWLPIAIKKAGIEDFRPHHDLRHTFGARFTMTPGVPLRSVQVALDHRNIKTTEKYSHLAPDFQQEMLERMGALYGATAAEPERKVANIEAGRRLSEGKTKGDVVASRRKTGSLGTIGHQMGTRIFGENRKPLKR